MTNAQGNDENLELVFTIFCDDVRLEAGHKLSFMGVFQNIMVQQLPVTLIKFAVVNHWRGQGTHLSEVRILTPDRQHPVVVSQPTSFEIAQGGFADNISFFVKGFILFMILCRSALQIIFSSDGKWEPSTN